MINKKYYSKKAQMSYTQILILVISIIAFSFLIGGLSETVSAQTGNTVCCAETKNGQTCQDVGVGECQEGAQQSPNECKDTVFCEPGCCFSEGTGLCNINTPKKGCEKINGAWFDNLVCNTKQCEKGCCVLGNEGKFTTEKNCEVESGFKGIPTDFKPEIKSESECIFLSEKDDEGACVMESEFETSCIFTTREDCFIKTKNENDFYKDIFCSDSGLNTTCEAQDHTGCVEGRDEVYWFDSCGNKEEIEKACSIFLGTLCGQYRPGMDEKPDEGDYVCRSLDCNTEDGVKKNGESWCEYEGTIGKGKDTVGSRHFRHLCYLGEEKIEPCSDYRNQICVQSDTGLADGSEFSEAACRVNRWRSCYEYNNEKEGMAEKCEENPDCYVHSVNVDDNFNFDICVPNYPPGFDLNNQDPSKNGEMECSLASQKCTVIYVKRTSGWKCEANCNCEEIGFTQQMNDLCVSLGDCGGYVNWEGEYTDDGYTSGAGKISGEQYKKYAKDNPGQKPAEPGNFGFSQILGIPTGLGEGEIPIGDEWLGMLGAGLGAYQMMKGGASVTAASNVEGITKAIESGEFFFINPKTGEMVLGQGAAHAYSQCTGSSCLYLGGPGNTGQVLDPVKGWSEISKTEMGEKVAAEKAAAEKAAAEKGTGKAAEGGLGKILGSIGAGLSIAGFLQAGFGMEKGASYGLGSLYAAIMYFGPASWFGPMAIVGLALTIYSMIAGLGKSKKKVITFSCYPWQAPTGGNNCEKCNANDVICSEYKCKSLGQTCEFINRGSLNEKCVDNSPTDVSSPQISPLLDVVIEGYNYQEVQNNGFSVKTESGDCIDEYTMIEYGIETDKPAQCKMGTSPMQSYEEMEKYFGGRNLYLTEHTDVIFMPSPAAFKNQYNLTDAQIADLGEINFYIKCKSVNGIVNTVSYTIRSCVEPGPDLTAPRVTNTFPENGAYIAYDQTEQDLQIYVNEPVSCKYSNEDKNYDLMENSMGCKQDLEDYGLYGWPCNTTLTNVGIDNQFYIKCQDLSDNKNIMVQSHVYELSSSKSELSIEDFRPADDEDIFEGVEPITIEFKVKTAGGAEDGKAVCEWEGNGYSDQFIKTDSNFHSYLITSATRGRYNINFFCKDVAGNTAKASTSFKIRIDNMGPRITRIYYEGGLKIWTNEEAECRYDFNKRFIWENATVMSGWELEHTADWQLKTYYIQCKDGYGNKGGKVAVKGYSLVN